MRLLTLAALIFYGQATAICCSIRYGFLADSFSSRHVSGTIYGTVEGSMIVGFAFIYCMGGFELMMRSKKVNSRYILMGITAGYAVTSLATGFVFYLDNSMTVVVLSTVLRIMQGFITYGCPLVAVDFINARLSTEFDFANGLLNMGYFSGHGMAEVFGCLLYDRFGYLYPFIFSSSMALLSTVLIGLVIPKSTTYLASYTETDTATRKLINPSTRLTKVVIFPILACMIINLSFGVLQVRVLDIISSSFIYIVNLP